MNFEYSKLIGSNIDNIPIDKSLIEMELNQDELDLNEGISLQWNVKITGLNVEMILDEGKVINTIFLRPNENGSFPFRNLNSKIGRLKVQELMGVPDMQGEPYNSPIIGFYGGFDRYDKEIAYHFEYSDEQQTQLKMITLMSL